MLTKTEFNDFVQSAKTSDPANPHIVTGTLNEPIHIYQHQEFILNDSLIISNHSAFYNCSLQYTEDFIAANGLIYITRPDLHIDFSYVNLSRVIKPSP